MDYKNSKNSIQTGNETDILDFQMAFLSSYNHFMHREIEVIPVVRIFGSTLLGQKCCVNVHNYYPYFFVEINQDNYFPVEIADKRREFAYVLESCYLNYEKDKQDKEARGKSGKDMYKRQKVISTQIIHNIQVTEKKNFYGYSKNTSIFLKIEVYSHKFIKTLMNILQGSVISGRYFQCFDAHISYSMHFFADFGLYGMGLIKLKNFSFRYPIPLNAKIDFTSQYSSFTSNIIWDSHSKQGHNLDIQYEVQPKFINDDIAIWDYFHLVNSGEKVIYNLFKKSSKSSIEIDATCDDILIPGINDKDNDNDNDRHSQPRTLENDIVNLINLRKHIRHTKCLIDLWDDEIERRTELNLEPLTIDKISNQNFFMHTESLNYKDPTKSEKLLRLNTKPVRIPEMIDAQVVAGDYNFFSSEERYKDLISVQIKFHHKNWSTWNKRGNFYNKKNNLPKEAELVDDLEINDIMSTISEISLPNETRNKIREVMTTKSIDEYFSVSDMGESVKSMEEESESKLENKYQLLSSRMVNMNLCERKRRRSMKSLKTCEQFQCMFQNLYTFRKTFPDYTSFISKLKENYHYDLRINKFLLSLYYSNIQDYLRFGKNKKKSLKINQSRPYYNNLLASHVGLNYFMSNYNTVTKAFDIGRSYSITKRHKRIEKLIQLTSQKKTLEESQGQEKSPFMSLRVLKYYNLIFMGKSGNQACQFAPTFNDVKSKLNSRVAIKKAKRTYDETYFNKKFRSADSLDLSGIDLDCTVINLNYFNEISPLTQKKYNPCPYNFTNHTCQISKHSAGRRYESPLEKELLSQLSRISGLVLLSVEILAEGKDNLTWNFEQDPILAIFCTVHDDNARLSYLMRGDMKYSYYQFIITSYSGNNICKRYNYSNFILSPDFIGYRNDDYDFPNLVEIFFAKDEISLLMKFAEIVTELDPDIIMGYETEMLSIAYIIRRAEYLGYPLRNLISRLNTNDMKEVFTEEFTRENMKSKMVENKLNEKNKHPITDHHDIKYMEQKFGSVIKIRGRIIMNIWRILMQDLKLMNYQLENVVFNVLQIRECKFSCKFLLDLFKTTEMKNVIYTFHYYMKRSRYNLTLIDELDIVNRETQFIKIYGIDFESSLTRGSQYRVEGLLSRLSKTNGYLLLSASRNQVRHQSPPEYTPMVREPPKNIFYCPVAVLDFQSLYPSIMIAYNICYTTCLGRLLDEDIATITQDTYSEDFLMFTEQFKKFGVYKFQKNILAALKNDMPADYSGDENKYIQFIMDNCIITPNKSLFVKKNIREGILPIILNELLLTRIMIKNSMKKYEKQSQIFKNLQNRQLGIKLLANVTYGYTSAGFSGRMPCSEIGDSIVSLGKEILSTTIKFIEENHNWKAKVIYGDTDSVFIAFEGMSPEQAMKTAKEIAEMVTSNNPEPIKLQFEKIYCPMVLLSKKHYAGYKFEDLNQIRNQEKNLESKGIETVRRDTCEAVCKIMEKSIKILFDKRDLSELKSYLYRTFDKILTGKAMIKDFIFAKEVKLGIYRGNNLPPSAQLAFNKHLKDHNYLPRYKEREPYLVIANSNGSKKLKDCIVSPDEYFSSENIFLNTSYYIEKQILPAVARILEPINVNVFEWYDRYPRPQRNFSNYFYNKNYIINQRKSQVQTTSANTKEASFFKPSKYSLVINEGERSKKIENYFSKRYKGNDNEIHQNGNTFLRYKELVHLSMNMNEDAGFERRKLIMEIQSSNKKRNCIFKKINDYDKICRVCSEFHKFNLSFPEVPCNMYLCKLLYEKLMLTSSNSLDEKKVY